jgi:hypothetical protein
MRNGDILCHPDLTDSHEDLLKKYKIRDGYNQLGKFCRVEYIPTDLKKITDFSTWKLIVDEKIKPGWLDEDRIKSSLNERVKRMFVDEEIDILLGGCWILLSNAHVKTVKNACIKYMLGKSKVGSMHDSSRVLAMRDSSKVDSMHDSSRVLAMFDLSNVFTMYDLSSIGYMRNSSKVENMYDSSKVTHITHSSSIGHMYDSSSINTMHDSSRVNIMYASSRIENDERKER